MGAVRRWGALVSSHRRLRTWRRLVSAALTRGGWELQAWRFVVPEEHVQARGRGQLHLASMPLRLVRRHC